jgi:fibronectin-binding autotransporter adhesin
MSKILPSLQALESRLSPATFTVKVLADSGTDSLRAALAAADASPGPDKIVFKLPAPAAHSENTILLAGTELTSKGNVTITGPGAGKLIINAQGTSRAFHIDDGSAATDSATTISGLSIIKGTTGGIGGGVLSAESLTLKSVIISQCSASEGGAVEMSGSPTQTFAISNSFITDNSASDAGGLDLRGLKTITIKKTVVTGNTASVFWGGIAVDINPTGTGIAITGSTISDNTAPGIGGMLLRNDATSPKAKTIVSGTLIADNSSTSGDPHGGGGALLYLGNVVVSGSTIQNNSAVYNGGGLAVGSASSLTISKSTIAGNRTTATNAASQGGGGIFIEGAGAATLAPVSITGSSITDNSSALDGGGLLATNGVALTISGTTFAGNRAADNGGGINATGTGANEVNLTIKGGTFSNNLASNRGGAVFALGGGPISVSSTKVTGNASQGLAGGMYLDSSAAANGVVLKNLTVSGNAAPSGFAGGGVLIINTADFHITGGSFFDNKSGGGAIAIAFSSGSILGVTVTGNDAASGGGGIWQLGGGTVVVQAAKVFGNTAPTDPDFFGTFTFV